MEHDALAAETETTAGDDPFADVPADGGETDLDGGEADLVQPGHLPGENPSEADPLAEAEQDELPAEGSGDPLAEPAPDEVLSDPEAEAEPEVTEPAPPAAEPATEPEPQRPEPEQKASVSGNGKKRKRRSKSEARKAEREYVVVQCDDKDSPVGIAGEVTARTDKDARRTVFDGMEDKEANLCAVPARYWKVKTLRKKTREVNDIEEE